MLLRDRIVLSPHRVATASVTSACIWDKSRLIAAKTLISTGVGKLTYIATYEMYGAYARQIAYLCREEENFLEPFFEMLLSLEQFSSKYSDTLQKCYGTSMWDDTLTLISSHFPMIQNVHSLLSTMDMVDPKCHNIRKSIFTKKFLLEKSCPREICIPCSSCFW